MVNISKFAIGGGDARSVSIVGGGALAHVLAGMLASQGIRVKVLTRKPEKWADELKVFLPDGSERFASLVTIDNDPTSVIPKTEIVLIALPGFALEDALKRISPYLNENMWVGSVVASTGFFFFANKLLSKKVPLFAFERVPYVARTIDYGRSAKIFGFRKEGLRISGIRNDLNALSEFFGKYLNNECNILESPLDISIVNSNPILHPSRLYALFGLQTKVTSPRKLYFYADWNDAASEVLVACDEELQSVRLAYGLTCRESILEHYESKTIRELTEKIKNIEALSKITVPCVWKNGVLAPDVSHRYFQEDVSYGLSLIRALAKCKGVATPHIDEVYSWAKNKMSKGYSEMDEENVSISDKDLLDCVREFFDSEWSR